MNIGRRRHPVEIQREHCGPDGVDDWKTIATEWAAIDSVTGQLQGGASVKVTLPYRDMNNGERLVYHGKQYIVRSALPNNSRSEMTLLCEVMRI